ncbi:MAG: hypothetical protein V1663_03575 [archaeon]
MISYPNLTIQLCNYNGLRNKIRGKGRLEITIESLLECCPFVPETNILLIDNESSDGSDKYLFALSFGNKMFIPHIFKGGWMGINNS